MVFPFVIGLLISLLIVSEHHNILYSIGFTILLSFLLLARLDAGINLFFAGSYLLPLASKIVYAYQQKIYVKDFLTSLPDWLLVMLMAIFLARSILAGKSIIEDSLDRYILAYLAVTFVYIFVNKNGIIVGVYGARMTMFPIFMYFLAKAYFINSSRFSSFFRLIIIFSLIEIGYGFYQYIFGYPYFDLIRLRDFPELEEVMLWMDKGSMMGFRKLFSMSGGSYHLFYPLAIFFIIGINVFKHFTQNVINKFLLYAFFLSFIPLLLLGTERTPIAMIIIGLAVSMLDYSNKQVFFKGVVVATSIIILSLIILKLLSPILEATGQLRFVRIAELLNPTEADTVQSRMTIHWKDSIDYIIETRGLGVGIGASSEVGKRANPDAFTYKTHNMFLATALETGLIGLTVFLLLFVKIIRNLIQILKGTFNAFEKQLARALLGCIAAISTSGLFNIPLTYHLGIFFWFLIGYSSVIYNDNRASKACNGI